MSHKSFKTALIFTTFIRNTYLDSLNKHMCCNLQRINRTYKTKQRRVSPTAATLLELL